MEPEDLEQLTEKLRARRDELIAEGDLSAEPIRKDPSDKLDEDEAPLTEMNQIITSRRNKTRALELQRIEAALQRIAADPDEFGICEECGDDIPIGRMEIMPWARFCVQCTEERSPRRGGRRRHTTDYVD